MWKASRLRAFSGSSHLRLLMVFVLLAQPVAGLAQTWTPWTTVGSAGTVDTSDKDIAIFSGSWVGVDGTAPLPSTVDVRYNVVAVPGLLVGGGRHNMKVRFIDNGDQARVIINLRELDIATGAITTRITFDSNSFPSSIFSQAQTVTGGCTFPFPPAPWAYSFETKVYYLETQITKSSSSGSAWVAAIQLSDQYCVG